MNRSLKEFSTGGRNVSVHRRGLSLNGMSKDSDDKLDLFSKSRRSLSVVSSDESDVSVKLGRLSVGSVKLTRNGVDDLLASTDGGKHDYDWLLTPPETPLFPSSDGSDTRPSLTASRNSLSRSASTAKASRLSITHSESNHSSRPVRSSSVTRSSSQYNSYANKSSSILNTSSASVSSYTRPSTPTRSSSISRPSTPSSRSVSSRSSTPSRTRPGGAPTTSVDRTAKPSQTSRPSTPSSSRSQIPATMNSLAPRTVSRPSTPTRRNPPPTLSSPTTSSTHSPSNGRYLTNGQPARVSSRPSSPSSRVGPTAPSSRPSSPSSRSRPTVPLILPEFLLDIPPNLRTTLPDRPLSAGRSRPGSVTTTTTSKLESSPSPANLTRRQSSPILNRGRLTETNTRLRVNGNNGQATDGFDSRKVVHVSDSSLTSRKPIKSSTISNSMDSTGFGRNISKKSMDMAMRHMDIRNGSTTSNNLRSLTGSSLFPQSIRSANGNNNKVQSARGYGHQPSSNGNMLSLYDNNGHIVENEDYINRYSENGLESNGGGNGRLSGGRMNEPDIYESSRYDAILLKEDLKNTNWLHSIDDKSDQSSIFDHGFELLPEPFDPL